MTKEFFDRYKYKISNIDKITKILKKNKKLNKKSVMCHGVFDVVHPGHIRHLAFAKSKADILGIVHSHPDASNEASEHDIDCCNALGIPYYIFSYPDMELNIVEPKKRAYPLVGREIGRAHV